MQNDLIKLFNRDLDKVKQELEAYSDEALIWEIDKNITNCSGNLALHLVGNLNHFIGAVLGDTGYIRKRELEFSIKDVPVSKLKAMLDETKHVVGSTLMELSDKDLQKEYRRNPFENFMTTGYFLLHLKSHLAYHLGQINYHRRLLDN